MLSCDIGVQSGVVFTEYKRQGREQTHPTPSGRKVESLSDFFTIVWLSWPPVCHVAPSHLPINLQSKSAVHLPAVPQEIYPDSLPRLRGIPALPDRNDLNQITNPSS